MKTLVVLVVIFSIILLIYLFYFSVKNLRQIQKQARENPQINCENELKTHTQTEKELAVLVRRGQKLAEKKNIENIS